MSRPPALGIAPMFLVAVLLLLAPRVAWAGGAPETTAGGAPESDAADPAAAGTHNNDAAPARPGAGPNAPAGAGPESAGATIDPSGPLTVEAATARALAVSDTAAIDRFSVDAARAGVDEARSRYFPQVGVRLSASYLTNPPEGISVRRGQLGFLPSPGSPVPQPLPDQDIVLVEDPENTFFQLTTTLSQTVLAWGKLNLGLEAAELERDLALINARSGESDLERDARFAYFGLRLARGTADMLVEAEEVLEQTVEDRRRAFDEGLINRETLLSAQADLARARTGRVEAAQGRSAAEEAMRVLLNADDVGSLETAPRRELPEISYESALEMAIATSTELQRTEVQSRQAEIGEEVERASGLFVPDLGLQVQLELSGQRVPFVAANWIDSWDAGVTVSLGTEISVFDGGASAARIAAAEARARQASRGLAALENGISLQVRRALETLRVNHARLQEAEAKLAFEEERDKNARVSFENELITRGDRRGARVLYLTAQFEEAYSAFEYERSLIELEALVGRRLVSY